MRSLAHGSEKNQGMPVRTDTPVVEDERSTTNVHQPLWMFLHN
ncbi:hypothetical protein [Nodularia spumigena]